MKVVIGLIAFALMCMVVLVVLSRQDATESPSVNEAPKHHGVVVYKNHGVVLIRVTIDGVDYIANNHGGIVRVQP